jgi:hypothetical protein
MSTDAGAQEQEHQSDPQAIAARVVGKKDRGHADCHQQPCENQPVLYLAAGDS